MLLEMIFLLGILSNSWRALLKLPILRRLLTWKFERHVFGSKPVFMIVASITLTAVESGRVWIVVYDELSVFRTFAVCGFICISLFSFCEK